jgi:hypothetical protein
LNQSTHPSPPDSLPPSSQKVPPIELWNDIKYPNYDQQQDPYEFEAINRISNYTYREPTRRYHHSLHYLYSFQCFNEDCWDTTSVRRGTSVAFVVAVIILGAALIGLVISQTTNGEVDTSTNTFADNDNSQMEDLTHLTSKYTPMRSHDQNIQDYTPQQLLELAEQVTVACDPSIITNSEKRQACQLICMDRMCCFENDKYGCSIEANKMCSVYIGCEVLYGDSNINQQQQHEDTSPKADLLKLADDIIWYCEEYSRNPQSAHGSECLNQCRDHMCCFEGDASGNSSCRREEKGNDFSCQVYEGCEVLVGVEEFEGEG